MGNAPQHGSTRLVAVAALACQQYLAVSLIYAAIPVVLRRHGASLELIGLFGMVFFAFTVNFLWAPLVDGWRLTRLGRRRSWMLAMQLVGAAVIAVIALRDPVQEQDTILWLCVALATVAATQRVATLGYVAEMFDDHERTIGAATVGWGGALGNVLGGALCLYLVERFGWQPALLALAAALLLFAVAIPLIAEPRPAAGSAPPPSLRALLARGELVRAENWCGLGVIAPATLGMAMAFAMVQPRLTDLGFGLAGIGTTIAATHLLAFSLVGPAAGILARRGTPARAVMVGSLAMAAGFVLLSAIDPMLGPAAGAIIALVCVFCALAAQSIVFTGLFFSLARSDAAATDVTFLLAGMSAVALAGFAASGFVAARFGYTATLAAAALGFLATAALASFLRPPPAR